MEDLLAATARKVVRSEAGTFDVVHDVAAPEHVPDKTRRLVLALVALDADHAATQEALLRLAKLFFATS